MGRAVGDGGLPVTLPETVEGQYWDRPPASVSGTAPGEIINARGSYQGVSWWYRPFDAPALRPGERLVFRFPGGRLRSEVYVNGRLCGYSIITEAPFAADATAALRPGVNQLAVRVTNPGGNFDWVDFQTFRWGRCELPLSHGFGGLDGGVTMEVRSPVQVGDLAVLNTPDVRTVTLRAEVSSTGPAYDGPVELAIARHDRTVWTGAATVNLPAGGRATVSARATVPDATLWDIDHAALYDAAAALPDVPNSARRTTFGFRWFTATGLGTDAKLALNGRRVVPKSSISWGFWAPNGLFPDRAAADREVAAVRALGLNSIQNHRHMPKPIVLDAFDRAGLLRYCEPGAGVFAVLPGNQYAGPTQGPVHTSGNGGEPTTFLARYELAKVLAMIRANRSHPSVSMWTLQNEVEPDLHNPQIFNVLRQMRALDPSRIIALKSGIGVANQAWAMPYADQWLHDDGSGASGWWDQHTAVDSPGVWTDGQYRSPADFMYRAQVRGEISVWGEMATGASPDDHAADSAWYQRHARPGYDRAAHEQLLGAYEQFIEVNGFRPTFPTAEALFLAAGNKHYFSAARLFENARMSDDNDYVVLSGWESTSVENHSGLVDSLRLLKGNPAPLRRAGAPEVLVVRARHYVVSPDQEAVVDIFLINEGGLKGNCQLTLSAAAAGGEAFFHQSFPVKVAGGETFGQLLKESVRFPIPAAGAVTLTATLASGGKTVLARDEPMLCLDPHPAALGREVVVAGESPRVVEALKRDFGVGAKPLAAGAGAADAILAVTLPGLETDYAQLDAPDLKVQNAPADAADPELYRHQLFGRDGKLRTFGGLAPGKATVELLLAEPWWDAPGRRVFDVALNGKTVLKDLDLFREAGGKGRVLVKTFEVPVADGTLALSVPRVGVDNATFAAIRITDAAGKVVRAAFRAENYSSPIGEQ